VQPNISPQKTTTPDEDLQQIDLRADELNNRGVSHLEQGREEEALTYFHEALKEDHQHLEATFNYAYLQWQRATITSDDLVTRVRELELLNKNSPDYWYYLAWIHLARGDKTAIESIQASEHRVTNSNFLNAYADPTKPVGRLVRLFKGHDEHVYSVCLSPDGRYALSGSYDETIRLWSMEKGKELKRFRETGCSVFSVCFSPDGRYAVSGGAFGAVSLWEVKTGMRLRQLRGHTEHVQSVCFSADGRHVLSGSADNTVALWSVETGEGLRRFFGHTSWLNSVCFSPDGKYALSGGADKTIRLWDIETGKELRRIEGHTDSVHSVGFSADGRYALSGGADKTIRLWDVATGKELRRIEGHGVDINSVCFSPDGRYALSAGWKAIRLWELATGKELRSFTGHASRVESVCFSRDGRYALSGGGAQHGDIDNSLRLWEIFFSGDNWKKLAPFPVVSPIGSSARRQREERKAEPVQVLMEALARDKDYEAREKAAQVLGELHDVRAVEALIVALKDQNHRVRQSAALALGHISDPRAVGPLLAALKIEHTYRDISDGAGIAAPGIDMHLAVRRALVGIGASAIGPLFAALKNRGQDEDVSLLAGAISEIGTPAVESCIAALKDDDTYVRTAAAWALRDIGDPGAMESLVAALKDQDRHVRYTAAEALAKIDDLRVVEPLISVLKDEYSQVRKKAAEALRKFSTDARALKALENVQSEKLSEERRDRSKRRAWSELLVRRTLAEANLAFPQHRAVVAMVGIKPLPGMERGDSDRAEAFVSTLETTSSFDQITFRVVTGFYDRSSNRFEFVKHSDFDGAIFSGFFWPPHDDWACTPLIFDNDHLEKAVTP
jgi:WD40 repeat protein/HEAT repeat protein